MAFSSSLSRERASLTKQARIYSDREQARIYTETQQAGIFPEGEVERLETGLCREEEGKRMKATDKPHLLNVGRSPTII